MLQLIVQAAEGFIRLVSGTGLMAQSPFSSCLQQHQYHLPLTFLPGYGSRRTAALSGQRIPWVTPVPDVRFFPQLLCLVEGFFGIMEDAVLHIVLFMLPGISSAGCRKCIAGICFLPAGNCLYISHFAGCNPQLIFYPVPGVLGVQFAICFY